MNANWEGDLWRDLVDAERNAVRVDPLVGSDSRGMAPPSTDAHPDWLKLEPGGELFIREDLYEEAVLRAYRHGRACALAQGAWAAGETPVPRSQIWLLLVGIGLGATLAALAFGFLQLLGQ